MLLGAGINWTPHWGLTPPVQYNPKTRNSRRSTVALATARATYRTVERGLPHAEGDQPDRPAQRAGRSWAGNGPSTPLAATGGDKGRGGGRWYSVGRLNYSLQDRKLVDTVVGLEYESCCWIGRVVLRAPAKQPDQRQHPAAVPDRVPGLLAPLAGLQPPGLPAALCAGLPDPGRQHAPAQPLQPATT